LFSNYTLTTVHDNLHSAASHFQTHEHNMHTPFIIFFIVALQRINIVVTQRNTMPVNILTKIYFHFESQMHR